MMESYAQVDTSNSQPTRINELTIAYPTKSDSCKIDALPNEMLVEIFKYIGSFDEDWYAAPLVHDKRTPPPPPKVSILRVSSHWCRVAHTVPELWTRIAVDSQWCSRDALKRSRKLPLALTLYTLRTCSDEFLLAACIVCHALPRATELNIIGEEWAWAVHQLFIDGLSTFPDSKRLSEDHASGPFAERSCDDPQHLAAIPRYALRVLRISGSEHDVPYIFPGTPCLFDVSGLKSLRLDNVCIRPFESWPVPVDPMSWQEARTVQPLIDMLALLPTLEHLHIVRPRYWTGCPPINSGLRRFDGRTPTLNGEPMVVTLSHLRTLRVRDREPLALALCSALTFTPGNVELELWLDPLLNGEVDVTVYDSESLVCPPRDTRVRNMMRSFYGDAFERGAQYSRAALDVFEESSTSLRIELSGPEGPPGLPVRTVLIVDTAGYPKGTNDLWSHSEQLGWAECAAHHLSLVGMPLTHMRELAIGVETDVEDWLSLESLARTQLRHITFGCESAFFGFRDMYENFDGGVPFPLLETVALDKAFAAAARETKAFPDCDETLLQYMNTVLDAALRDRTYFRKETSEELPGSTCDPRIDSVDVLSHAEEQTRNESFESNLPVPELPERFPATETPSEDETTDHEEEEEEDGKCHKPARVVIESDLQLEFSVASRSDTRASFPPRPRFASKPSSKGKHGGRRDRFRKVERQRARLQKQLVIEDV